MSRLIRPLSVATALSLALGGSLPSALAQDAGSFRSMPCPATPSAANTTTCVNVGPASYNAGYNSVPVGVPCYSTGYYGPGAAVGNYLSGAADVFNAQGQYQIQRAQGRIMTEQWKQSQLETRRKTLDEWNYERANTPTFQDIQERERQEALRSAMHDPPLTQILSGTALNALLAHIQTFPFFSTDVDSLPYQPVDPSVMAHINVTSGASPGSLGLLRDNGQLQWPFVLKLKGYDTERKKMDELSVAVFKQAQQGNVDANTLEGMNQTLKALQQGLDNNVDQMTPGDYTRSNRYLRELSQTISTLQDPNVAKLATHKWSAKGTSVGHLVMELTREGLHFAPAVSGDEAAYVALQRAMASYDQALGRVAMARR